jgi:hypothetical protein
MGLRLHAFVSLPKSVFFCAVLVAIAGAASARAELSLTTGSASYSLAVRSYRDIPFRTTIRQQYDYSCGSSALATLLRFHYGRDVGESEIFKAMFLAGDQQRIQKVGFSLLDMKQYLERVGLKADGFRMSVEELQKNATPAITIITIGPYKHFVVIKGIKGGRVLTGDPALGLKTYAVADFEKIWGGIVFMIHDDRIDKASFNSNEDWNPWARAPTSERFDKQALFGTNAGLPAIYQIPQLTFSR